MFKGVPLKHVVDNFFTPKSIKNFDGTEQETIFMEFMASGGNYNMNFETTEDWSDKWLNWSKRHQPNQMPLQHVQTIELENACKNPAPLQPASTHNKITNKLFFISNEKFMCHMIS